MPRPSEPRLCACGQCGIWFQPKSRIHRFAHPVKRQRNGPHYTAAEQRQRRILQAHPPQGDPCPRCGQPMWPEQRLQTGHVVDRALGGSGHGFRWEHGRCNASAGATMGNRLRLQQTAVQQTPAATRDW